MGGIDTKGRFHVHWGPPETYGERREESAIRRSGRPVADAAFRALRPRGHDRGRRDPGAPRLRPQGAARDPRGDAGRVRLPPRRRAQAHQPRDRRLVRVHLRHRQLLPPPALRAAGHPDRPGRRAPRTSPSSRATAPRSTPRSATRRARAADEHLPHDPQGVAARPDRARRRARRDRGRPGPRRPQRRLRGPAQGGPRPRRHGHHRHRRRRPACAAAAARASRPARSGAPRRTSPPASATSSPTATAPIPSVRTDATLIAADPWTLIEGITIAAFAVGATEAIIAVRAEDTALITLLEGAILAAEEAGFLGDDVMGSGYRVTVTVRPVQGAYMLGEETVLLKALEGRRGQPEQRPPYPTERGLFDKPTVVNNVQTLAVRAVDHPRGCRGVRGHRQQGQPGHRPRPAARPRGRRDRRGPAWHAPQRARAARRRHRQAEPQGAPRRRSDRRPAPGRSRSTCRTTTTRSARPAPTSARAPSSSPTTAPASWTLPAC